MNIIRHIDREEFQKVMTLMRTFSRHGRKHSDGRRFGFKSSVSTNETGGIVEYFFGKDGKQPLRHGMFVQFLRDLHEEVYSCLCCLSLHLVFHSAAIDNRHFNTIWYPKMMSFN